MAAGQQLCAGLQHHPGTAPVIHYGMAQGLAAVGRHMLAALRSHKSCSAPLAALITTKGTTYCQMPRLATHP